MSGAGTIYFTSSYSTNDATFDHNNPSLSNLTDLTLQGGWNGFTGAGFDLSGVTDFGVALSILNWDGDVTLNDLIFSATGSDGVYVTTSGNIRLDHVDSSRNNGRGAYLNNTSGGTGVGVTVKDSSFQDNLTGLDISSDGDISLAYVDASYNAGAGSLINGGGTVAVDQSNFSWNGLYGLDIASTRAVSLSEVDALHNGSDGTRILSDEGITIENSNFSRNGGTGLRAQAVNSIYLEGVDASNDEASGLSLISDQYVTLTRVSAGHNGDSGASIWTDWDIVVDSSIFDGNDQDGVYAKSLYGDITVKCSDFLNNGDYGVDADLPGTLKLNGDGFSGNGAGAYAVGGGGGAEVHPRRRCDTNDDATPVPTRTPASMLTSAMNVVHVLDGQVVRLDCTAFRGTVLVLSNGDQVVLPCPISGQASLASVGLSKLPGPLHADLTLLSGMDAEVSPSLDGVMIVDFVVPLHESDVGFRILRWDDTEWIDLGGIRSPEGFLEARSSLDGVFVLVTR
jgi:hypothetical protein